MTVPAASTDPQPPRPARTGFSASAIFVMAGILLSRVAGYARVRIFAHLFGVESAAADAFNAALRLPNFLQNLFGEGVLSASLIPVYSGLLQQERQEEADRVARAILAILAFLTAVLVLIGVRWTPELVPLIAPGFTGVRRDLTIQFVRVMFPGIGLLVLSAWCLAILNSHRRFFLAYVAPVSWNLALIATLIWFRHRDLPTLGLDLAWAAVVGSGLQLAVQVPIVWRVMSRRWIDTRVELSTHVRRVILTSLPVIFTRGVVQVSAYIDGWIASYLPLGAVTGLTNAQQIYTLPVSLFGMAVAAAELPAMSGVAATENGPALLRERLETGQRTIAILVVPSVVALVVFGDLIVSVLLQGGRFSRGDSLYVWAILAGSAVGLLSTTLGRLFSSAYYALGDTTTPTTFAIARVIVVAALGYACAIPLPPLLGLEPRWGATGLTVSAGLAGWIEFALLRASLHKRLGVFGLRRSVLLQAWGAAVAAAVAATGLRWVIAGGPIVLRGLAILVAYGVLYLATIHYLHLMRWDEVRRVFLTRRRKASS